ncbi:hypothetical protein G6F32_016959 [Rhizopus arrhizus]|nr:hypothetical protein G6F32_016959 [Rhizopus arrhizus]
MAVANAACALANRFETEPTICSQRAPLTLPGTSSLPAMKPPARPTTTMRSGDQPWRQTWLSVDQWSWVSTSRTVTT